MTAKMSVNRLSYRQLSKGSTTLGAVHFFNGQNYRGTNVSDSIWPALSDARKISSIDKQKSAYRPGWSILIIFRNWVIRTFLLIDRRDLSYIWKSRSNTIRNSGTLLLILTLKFFLQLLGGAPFWILFWYRKYLLGIISIYIFSYFISI